MSFFFQKLDDLAEAPYRGSAGAAGWDLKSVANIIIPARSRALVKTGLVIMVPSDTYGRIAPRSGLALNNGIDVGAGVIDADYRGEVGILLFNHSDSDFQVNIGDRVAQLILEKIDLADATEILSVDATPRGNGGFGSTGI